MGQEHGPSERAVALRRRGRETRLGFSQVYLTNHFRRSDGAARASARIVSVGAASRAARAACFPALIASKHFARPAAVRGPVESPPCIRQRPPRPVPGALQGLPVDLACAPQVRCRDCLGRKELAFSSSPGRRAASSDPKTRACARETRTAPSELDEPLTTPNPLPEELPVPLLRSCHTSQVSQPVPPDSLRIARPGPSHTYWYL